MRRGMGVPWVVLMVLFLGFPRFAANAKDELHYASSAQVYEAFGKEALVVFQRKTGIEVDTKVSSSAKAVQRLEYDFADVASTARRILPDRMEHGYVSIPFCKDPLVVIAHVQCPVESLTEDQLQDIFSGDLSNWKAVGGPDQAIVRVVPDENTSANKNFRRLVMKYKEIGYDIMTYRSTDSIVVTEKFTWAVSFVARGAVYGKPGIRIMKIDGRLPDDPGYPFFQVFHLVTKTRPTEPVSAFVDFVFSEEGRALIKKKGMIPVERTP